MERSGDDVKVTKEEQPQSSDMQKDDKDEQSVSNGEQDNGNLKRARTETKNKNKQVECKICLRKMRSDNLKRHMHTHQKLYTLEDVEMREELKRRKQLREVREEQERVIRKIAEEENVPLEWCDLGESDAVSLTIVEKELMDDEEMHKKKIERGKMICNILEDGNVEEDSLSRCNKDALRLYRKRMPRRHLNNAQLRPWQEQLMNEISIPTDREILWIIGQEGNEGKTWFQEYVEVFYGYARVVRLDLAMRTANVLHALTKRPLSSVDIFLFNLPRSVDHDSCNYFILESIKDGTAVSSKYNNEILRFKSPNVIIIFSNDMPNWGKLSADRWKVFRIENDELDEFDVHEKNNKRI